MMSSAAPAATTGCIAVKLASRCAPGLRWSMQVGAWWLLGTLGRQLTPLWIAGMAPLALWLAVDGLSSHALRGVALGRRQSRLTVLCAGLATAAALSWMSRGGGAAALFCAAATFGLLTAGLAGEAGCGAGFCAVSHGTPPDGHQARNWAPTAAGWSMLPMMATLSLMPEWCGAGAGPNAATMIFWHVAAMSLPALTFGLLGGAPSNPRWVALPMALGLVPLICWPGVQGWMGASLCQAAAWGMSRFPGRPIDHRQGAPASSTWMRALLPAALVVGFAVALSLDGPRALGAVQCLLSVLAMAGASGATTVRLVAR